MERDRERLCSYCSQGAIETESHFIIECCRGKEIRKQFFPKLKNKYPESEELEENQIIKILLGEEPVRVHIAARYVDACHRERESPHQ